MAFDIEIDYGGIESPFWMSLEFSEFNILFDVIKEQDNLPLLKRCLANYFGDGEIYLNELNDLKIEIIKVRNIVKNTSHSFMENLLVNFLILIEIAIREHKCIKFFGD